MKLFHKEKKKICDAEPEQEEIFAKSGWERATSKQISKYGKKVDTPDSETLSIPDQVAKVHEAYKEEIEGYKAEISEYVAAVDAGASEIDTLKLKVKKLETAAKKKK